MPEKMKLTDAKIRAAALSIYGEALSQKATPQGFPDPATEWEYVRAAGAALLSTGDYVQAWGVRPVNGTKANTPTLRDRLARLAGKADASPYSLEVYDGELIAIVGTLLDRVEALEADRHAREAHAAERNER